MPFVNVKVVEKSLNDEKREQIISGLTDLVVNVMGRDRSLTNIVIDEIKQSSWGLGGKAVDGSSSVGFVNIKVSKGTTNPDEVLKMQVKVKELMSKILGNYREENYFIVDELNSYGWGFGDLTMAERAKLHV